MTQFSKLLAKSIPPQDSYLSKQEYDKVRGAATFVGHTGAVVVAAQTISEILGPSIATQLQLEDVARWQRLTQLGAYLHDWGKANQHFQEMVYLKSSIINEQMRKEILGSWDRHGSRQLIRHEFLSGILALKIPKIREWLLNSFTEQDLILAIWSVIGHHLKAGANEKGTASGDGRLTQLQPGSFGLWVYTGHPDFQKVLLQGNKHLGLPQDVPEIPSREWTREELEDDLSKMYQELREFEKDLGQSEQVLAAAVKATVIAADLAGSAVPLLDEKLADWLTQVLQPTLDSKELGQLVQQRLQGAVLRPFQEQVARTSHRVTVVRAGCGTGKTIAAYAWAEKHAVGRRLFFCYPTTGTATQGYLDYAEGTPIEAQLMHSRADIDRELLFSGEGEQDEGISARLTALQTWWKKLIVCTVDSVLGLMQNNRRPLYAWPVLVQSAFVFDEVHAYDERLFGALLRFLEVFRGAPILLMSASFTPGQLAAIYQVLERIGEPQIKPISGPQELEQLKRYRLQRVCGDIEVAWPSVQETLAENGKVLWVTNTVASCIEIYRQAKHRFGHLNVPILIYHSRFRYRDRVRKHQQVTQAFKQAGPVLVITTQVCEMSLDLSADLLVSAMAPAWSLIQRLGRLNRRMQSPLERACPALFYDWPDSHPYTAAELQTGEQLLEVLSGQDAVSQADLATAAVNLGQTVPQPVASAWLDGKSRTYQDYLREEGYTITVLLGQDEPLIQQAAQERVTKATCQGQKLSARQAFMQEAQAWAIPIRIPQKTDWWKWRRRGFYLVTPPDFIQYSEEEGAA